MAYGIVHFFPGATKEQYEASLAAVHPGNGLPAGQVFHAAGPSEGGWTIVAIHDSKESWERFRDDILMPKLSAGLDGGFEGTPQETGFEVANHRTARAAAARGRVLGRNRRRLIAHPVAGSNVVPLGRLREVLHPHRQWKQVTEEEGAVSVRCARHRLQHVGVLP